MYLSDEEVSALDQVIREDAIALAGRVVAFREDAELLCELGIIDPFRADDAVIIDNYQQLQREAIKSITPDTMGSHERIDSYSPSHLQIAYDAAMGAVKNSLNLGLAQRGNVGETSSLKNVTSARALRVLREQEDEEFQFASEGKKPPKRRRKPKNPIEALERQDDAVFDGETGIRSDNGNILSNPVLTNPYHRPMLDGVRGQLPVGPPHKNQLKGGPPPAVRISGFD